MGDVLALVDEAQKAFDEKEQQRLQEQLEKGEFTLDDFRNHMQKMAKPGLMQKMLGLMPGMGNMKELNAMMAQGDTSKEIRRMVGIIDSMTPEERRNPKVIQVGRRQRIAQGAGVEPKAVNELVKQYDMMKPILTGMAGKGAGDRMQMMQDLQKNMMDPTSRMPKTKKSTGKRLTAKERAKMKKQRDKMLKEKRRKKRDK